MIKNIGLTTLVLVSILLLSAFSFSDLFGNTAYQGIEHQKLKQLLSQKTALVDIRRPEEWRYTGVIPNSQLITVFDHRGQTIPESLEKLAQFDKKQAIILICHTDVRARHTSKFLTDKLKFEQVYYVKNGISGWLSAGNETTKAIIQ